MSVAPPARSAADAAGRPVHLAYVVSRFPKITETFVLYEILELTRRGIPVDVFPLRRERQATVHAEAHEVVARAHYHPLVSPGILAANVAAAARAPRAYAGMLTEMLRGTWGDTNFFLGALAYLPKAVRFAREMARRGVTHVHAHFANHPALVALAVHRLTGIPYSFSAHGSDIHVRQRFLERKIDAAAFVVTISEYNKRFLLEHCAGRHGDKIRVVHCGVDPAVFREKDDTAPAGPLRIACVASYEEVKGHRHLVEACALLRDRGVDYVCDLVGDGPLRLEVERRLRAAGLQSHVVVHGALERQRVAELLRASDLAVLPSVPTARGDREGIPVVLMEAMAVGLPVVASRISGIPELVRDGETGLLVEPGDASGLAAALERLGRDPLGRRAMGRAGRRHVLAEFDLRANTGRLIDLFRRGE